MNARELLPRRVGALAGIAFVLLLFLSVGMVDFPKLVSDAELVEWWSSSSNLSSVLVSTYLQIGAGIAFLAFLTVVRTVSRRAEGGTGSLSTFAFASGVTYAVTLLASNGPRGAIAVAVKLNDEALPGVDLLRYLPQVGFVMMGTAGGVAVGASMIATAVVAIRTDAFGNWLGILGLVCGVACAVLSLVVGPFAIPLILLWVLATCVGLWRHQGFESTVAAPAAPVTSAAS